jgi:hypothetical protein
MSGRVRTAVRLVAVGALAFLLTGCLKMDINLTLSSNDTVSGSMIFAFDKQLLELTGQNPQDVIGSAAPLPSDVQGVSSKPYDDGKYAGQEFTFDSVPLSQFNTDDPSALKIVREGDVFKVSGTLDLSTGTDTTTTTDPTVQQALQSAEVKISITFPGEVTDTNGQVSGTTVTWSPKIGDTLDLQATGSAIGSGGSSSSTIIWVVVGVLLVLAGAVGVLLLIRKRQAAAGAVAEGAVAEGPTTEMASATEAAPMAGPMTSAAEPETRAADTMPMAEPETPVSEAPATGSEAPSTETEAPATETEAPSTENAPPANKDLPPPPA